MAERAFVSSEPPVQDFLRFMDDRRWPCPWAVYARDAGKLSAVLAPPMNRGWVEGQGGNDINAEIQRSNIAAMRAAFEQVMRDIIDGKAQTGFVVEQDSMTGIGEAYARTWGIAYPALRLGASTFDEPSGLDERLYAQAVERGRRYSDPRNVHEYLDDGIVKLRKTNESPEKDTVVFSVMSPHYPDELGKHMRWAPQQAYSVTPMPQISAAREQDNASGHLRKHVAIAKQTALRCHRLFNNNIPFPLSVPEHDADVFSFYLRWATLKQSRGIVAADEPTQ